MDKCISEDIEYTIKNVVSKGGIKIRRKQMMSNLPDGIAEHKRIDLYENNRVARNIDTPQNTNLVFVGFMISRMFISSA
jgi:hypothetical protein